MNTQRLVEEAAGDVDRSLLEGTGRGGVLSVGYFADGPLVDRLREGEGVDYALQNLTKGLTIQRDDQVDKVDSAGHYRSTLLVTEERLLYVVGQDEGDETFSIPLSRIQDVDTSTGIFKDHITVYTDTETYDMYVQKGSDIEEIGQHIVSATETVQSTPRTECNGELDSGPTSRDEEKTGTGADTDSDDEFTRMETNNVVSTSKKDSESSPAEDGAETERETGSTTVGSETTGDEPETSGGTSESGSDVATGSRATVEVLVSDDDGQPVADARVTVASTTFGAGGRTTQMGRCRLELPPGVGTVDVVVEHDQHGSIRENIPVLDGAVVDVTLAETGETETGVAEGTASDQGPAEHTDDGESGTPPSREELIEALVALDEGTSREVTRGRMRSKGVYKPENYEAEFGTWSAALKVAMLHKEDPETSSTTQQQEAYTKEDVLDAIREVAEAVGGRPTSAQMQEYDRISIGPVYRFFDSWGDAVSAALKNSEIAVEEAVAADVDDGASGRTAEADVAPDQDMEVGANVDEKLDTDGDEAAVPEPEPTDEDPLADGLEAAPTGRLSDVVVEVRKVHDVTVEKRAAEYEVKTAAADLVELVVWEKHEFNLDAEPGTRLCLDDIRLTRWETDDGLSHQLDSTADLDVSVVAEGESADGANGGSVPGEKAAVERFVSVGGATESDAEALVDAGYTTTEDLESASIEELRSITDLNDGTALRIKAEFG